MKTIICTIIGLCVFAGACSTKKDVETAGIELVKVDSLVLKPDTSNLFGTFYENFKINDTGEKLAFYDRIKEKVFVFDRQGNLIQAIGEYGKGPKGIISVNGYDFTSTDQIVIMDLRQRLLKVFGVDGEIVKTSPVFENDKIFVPGGRVFHVYNDTIYLPIIYIKYANHPDSSDLIGKMNLNGEIVATFGSYDAFVNEDNQYSLISKFDIDSNGKIIYTVLKSSYKINSYHLRDQVFKGEFGIQFPSFSMPGKKIPAQLSIPEINKRSTGITTTSSIHATEKYFIQNIQVLTKEWFETVNYADKGNFLVLYDMKTKAFLGEIHIPHTLGAVHDDQLYMIEDFNPDNYTIGIYELVEKK